MNPSEPGPLLEFCRRAGLSAPLHSQQMRSGRNSQVWTLHAASGSWVLKHYHQSPCDTRDRLGTEFGFLTFLHAGGINNVPEPLARDPGMNCGLYSLLPGARPAVVSEDDIQQAAQFIVRINQLRRSPAAQSLHNAAEACLSWQDHLLVAQRRIDQLQALVPTTEVEQGALEFVQGQLVPCWQRLREQVHAAVPASSASQLVGGLVLSPSDFGFHNSLVWQGQLCFLDFEYAGWDDPAKLVCDFLCQPELPVTATQGQLFIQEVLRHMPDAQQLGHRISRLLPVHRFKWCCLLLNEFKLPDRQRRQHAGVAGEDLLAGQLTKAKAYFQTHLA